MRKATSIPRLLLLLVASTVLLSACGGKEDAPEADRQTAAAQPVPPVQTAASSLEIACASIETLMNRLRGDSASGGLSLDSLLGADTTVLESRQSILDVTLVNPESDGSGMSYRQSAIIDENDAAAFRMEMDGGEEVYRSGIYFSGSDMLIRFSDVNEPMIRYGLSDASAAALAGQPPLKRYMACLASPDPASVLGAGWDKAWIELREYLQENFADSDVSQGDMELTVQDRGLGIATYALQLEGRPATDIMRLFYNAWNGDADVRAFLCFADNVTKNSEDGAPAPSTLGLLDAAMRSGEADAGAQGTLSLTVGILEGSPVYLDLRHTLPEGEFTLTMSFWAEGKAKQTDISLRALDGRGFDLRDVNSDGGGVFNQETVQTTYQPGGMLAAVNTLTAASTYESGGLSKTFSNEYRVIDREDGAEDLTLAEGVYSHTEANGEVSGVFSGRLTMGAQDGDPMIMEYNGTLLLSQKAGQVTIPEFITGSGRQINDHPQLLAALLKDEAPEYGSMPYSQQMMLATLALMPEVDDE